MNTNILERFIFQLLFDKSNSIPVNFKFWIAWNFLLKQSSQLVFSQIFLICSFCLKFCQNLKKIENIV